jgi:putative PIN family toxin of toxin-antitoxin system
MARKRDRVILDTNIWISFILTGDFTKLDHIFQENSIVLLFIKELIEEFIDVASRPKFRKYFPLEDLINLLGQIEKKSEFIQVVSAINLCRDPKDDFLLSLAHDGQATHLISGDKDLLAIGSFGKTRILTLADYLNQ